MRTLPLDILRTIETGQTLIRVKHVTDSESTKSRRIGAEATRLTRRQKVVRLGYDRRLTEILDFRRVFDKLLLLGFRKLVRFVIGPVLLPADQFPAAGRHFVVRTKTRSTTEHTNTNTQARTKCKRERDATESTEVGWRTAQPERNTRQSVSLAKCQLPTSHNSDTW